MMKKKIILIAFLTIPMLSNCQNVGNRAPKWIKKTPKSNSKIFAVGKASSASADIAYRKALLDANKNLAQQVEPVVNTKTTKIISAVENGKVVKQKVDVIRKKVSATLSGVSEIDKYQTQADNEFTVFVLLSMPKKAISRSIAYSIKEDSALLNKVGASKNYYDLLMEANMQ